MNKKLVIFDQNNHTETISTVETHSICYLQRNIISTQI